MYVTFSISCDVLHCFLTKLAYLLLRYLQGKTIFTPHAANFIGLLKYPVGYFRLCVLVTMELRQNIPRRFIRKNTNLRRCSRAAIV